MKHHNCSSPGLCCVLESQGNGSYRLSGKPASWSISTEGNENWLDHGPGNERASHRASPAVVPRASSTTCPELRKPPEKQNQTFFTTNNLQSSVCSWPSSIGKYALDCAPHHWILKLYCKFYCIWFCFLIFQFFIPFYLTEWLNQTRF